MPSLGADMDRGTILEWRKQPGQRVERGEIVVLVDTDKAEIEVESFEAGWMEALLVREGESVPVGTPIARIRTTAGAEAPPPPTPARVEAPPAPAKPVTAPPVTPTVAPPRPAGARLHVTPLARRRAQELGIDLASLHGSGADGAITRDDVERAAAAPAAKAPPAPIEAPARAPESRRAAMRSAIASAMERANREIPHYYLATRADLSRALARLQERNAALPLPDRVLPAALFLRATALAAAEVPALNGFWRDGAFVPGDGVHVGVIVSLRSGGLLAPALRDAATKSTAELMRELRGLVARARAGTLRSSEVAGATLSVTSLGEQGVETVFGIVMPPQVALVGFGRVHEEAVAHDGMLAARPVVDITLSADHRASDGHTGGRFLAAIRRRLEEPDEP